MSGNPRDPATIARVDLYAARGISDRTELRARLPLLASFIADRPRTRPCPTSDDYCQSVIAPGALDLAVRWQAVTDHLTVSGGVRGDPWLATTRTRYINVGQGVVGPTVGLIGGAGGKSLSWGVSSHLWATPGRAVPGTGRRAPAPTAVARAEVGARTGPVWWSGATTLTHRLGGVDYGPEYLRNEYRTDERWGVIQFGQAQAELQASLAVGPTAGVHIAVCRAYWTRNGPRDLTDIKVGVHRWIPSPRRRMRPPPPRG
ncbi:MAG: hypothetical protein ACI8PZ_003339 [Myxococcota bacterium]|jgi:hypothetical protein